MAMGPSLIENARVQQHCLNVSYRKKKKKTTKYQREKDSISNYLVTTVLAKVFSAEFQGLQNSLKCGSSR